jgi:hypothetical protein
VDHGIVAWDVVEICMHAVRQAVKPCSNHATAALTEHSAGVACQLLTLRRLYEGGARLGDPDALICVRQWRCADGALVHVANGCVQDVGRCNHVAVEDEHIFTSRLRECWQQVSRAVCIAFWLLDGKGLALTPPFRRQLLTLPALAWWGTPLTFSLLT